MNKRVRVALAALIAVAGAVLVLAIYMVGITDSSAAESDFISYWAAGHLLVRGQNPYDILAPGICVHRVGQHTAPNLAWK